MQFYEIPFFCCCFFHENFQNLFIFNRENRLRWFLCVKDNSGVVWNARQFTITKTTHFFLPLFFTATISSDWLCICVNRVLFIVWFLFYLNFIKCAKNIFDKPFQCSLSLLPLLVIYLENYRHANNFADFFFTSYKCLIFLKNRTKDSCKSLALLIITRIFFFFLFRIFFFVGRSLFCFDETCLLKIYHHIDWIFFKCSTMLLIEAYCS